MSVKNLFSTYGISSKSKYYAKRSPLICGSVALKHWIPWLEREAQDTDYIGYLSHFNFNNFGGRESFTTTNNFIYTNKKLRVEFIDVTNCPPLESIFLSNKDIYYLDPTNCLILKNSHKYFYLGKYKKSFKHLMDYSLMLDQDDFFLNEEDLLISNEYKIWLIENIYNNDERLTHFPNLNKTKKEFFTDKVKYFIDHDYIHEVVAIKKQPAYKQCLNGEVKFSNKKFLKLDNQTKINMVLEESFVLALERCLIPQFFGETYLPAFTPEESFKYALVRVATNITSGVFREFAANNFHLIYEQYLDKYINYYKYITKLLEVIK